jgi:nitroreductase
VGDGAATTDDIWEAMWTQRAIRYFRPEPVPDELLRKVIEAGTRAPNGTNQQRWAFMVVRDEGLRQKIGDHVARAIGEEPAFQARVDAGIASDDRSTRLMMSGGKHLAANLASAPALIFPCVVGPHPEGMDRMLFGSSIYLAAQNIMLAARAKGLGTVMTIFQLRMIAELREWLGIPENVTPVALIPIGWPDANFGPVKREPVEDVLHWDRW